MPTVKQLIEELQKFNPTDKVNLCNMDCGSKHLIVSRDSDDKFIEFISMEEF